MKEVRNNSLELRLSPESRLVEGYALVFNPENEYLIIQPEFPYYTHYE